MNEQKTLEPVINPTDATNKKVNWTSSDTSIVSVSHNGTVIAVGGGRASVTATAVDGI